MSISFESAVETLKTMFPDWDEETLSTILVSNQYHVENTIETVLSMSGQNEVSSTQQPPNNTSQQSNQLIGTNDEQVKPIIAPVVPVAVVPSSSSGSNNNYRGMHVELPKNFLRPPGWEDPNSYILADEELALMLQNELFQQQARQVEGGAELIAMMERSNDQSRRRQQTMQQYPNTNATTRQSTSNNQSPQSQSQPQSTESADLGIMKALSSMGTATKKSLSQLAQGFKTNNSSSSSSTTTINNSNTQNSNRNSFSGSNPISATSRRNSKNFQSLQDQDINHEDIYENGEETEVITFGGSGTHRHILNDEPSSDGNDAENPLLKQGGFQNLTISKKV